MTSTPRARTDIEVKPVARPYPERTRPLPWRREDVTAAWLTELRLVLDQSWFRIGLAVLSPRDHLLV